MHVYTPILHVLHSICKACDNLRMRGSTSKNTRNISNDPETTYALQHLAWQSSSPWHLLQTVIAVWFLKTNFHAF